MSKQSKKKNAVARTSRTAHILLIDDEEDITDILGKSLNRLGYKVTIFNDPIKGLKQFEPNRYDLAIVDVRMPGLNGLQLLKQFMIIDPKLKACLLTAFELIEEDLGQNSIDSSCLQCFMKKPIELSEFTKKVATLLQD